MTIMHGNTGIAEWNPMARQHEIKRIEPDNRIDHQGQATLPPLQVWSTVDVLWVNRYLPCSTAQTAVSHGAH
jgi:hypothetical protein